MWISAGEMWREVWGCEERCGKCVGGVGEVSGELYGVWRSVLGYMTICDDLLRERDKTGT